MEEDRATELLHAARVAADRAYAPYSGFRVGAAILAEGGAVFAGCNVENAAYPVGTCAEAGAVAAMVAGGARRIEAVLVAGPGPTLVTPCGACRQRLREFSADDVPVLLAGPDGVTHRMTMGGLLPLAFGPVNLGRIPTIEDPAA